MSGEMRVAKLIRYLTILTVSLVKAEHGGDEFKNWPVKPGPWVQPTKGEVWPKPKVSKPQQEFLVLRSNSFRFEVRDQLVLFDEEFKAEKFKSNIKHSI